MEVKIGASLMCANLLRMEDDIRELEKCGIDYLHFDIMDAHFVPNLALGPDLVKAVRGITVLPLDCHLMISDPDRYAELFIRNGANYVSAHVEGAIHLDRTLTQIRRLGAKPGVAVNPHTPLVAIKHVLPKVDFYPGVRISRPHDMRSRHWVDKTRQVASSNACRQTEVPSHDRHGGGKVRAITGLLFKQKEVYCITPL